MSLVLGLGLEHSCSWPRVVLSSERLSLALASDFFCDLGLGLEPCVLDSTSGEDVLKLSFLNHLASALVSFAITRNFKDKNILTYFGGNHLRSCAAAAVWLKAPVLKPNVLTPGFNTLVGHRFHQTNIILNLVY